MPPSRRQDGQFPDGSQMETQSPSLAQSKISAHLGYIHAAMQRGTRLLCQ
jgi:hypothetical protein